MSKPEKPRQKIKIFDAIGEEFAPMDAPEGTDGGDGTAPEADEEFPSYADAVGEAEAEAGESGESGEAGEGEGEGEGSGGEAEDSLFDAAVKQVMQKEQVITAPALTKALKALEVGINPPTIHVQVNDLPPVDLGTAMSHELLPHLVRRMSAKPQRIDTLMVGPTGCGKTHLFYDAAKACGLRAASLSCTSGASESHFTGRRLPDAQGTFIYFSTQFVDWVENGGAFLLDEVDAADPNVLLLMNQLLANGRLPIPNRIENPVAMRHPDFVLVAAANTYGNGADRMYVGRNQLDAATLDRFSGSVLDMDYNEKLEKRLVSKEVFSLFVHARKKAQAAKLRRAISTRAMLNADRLLKIGYTLAEVWKLYLAGWSPEEVSKVSPGAPV